MRRTRGTPQYFLSHRAISATPRAILACVWLLFVARCRNTHQHVTCPAPPGPPVRLAAPARALLSIMHRPLARPRPMQWHALAATGRGPAAQLLFQAQSGPSPCTRPPARPTRGPRPHRSILVRPLIQSGSVCNRHSPAIFTGPLRPAPLFNQPASPAHSRPTPPPAQSRASADPVQLLLQPAQPCCFHRSDPARPCLPGLPARPIPGPRSLRLIPVRPQIRSGSVCNRPSPAAFPVPLRPPPVHPPCQPGPSPTHAPAGPYPCVHRSSPAHASTGPVQPAAKPCCRVTHPARGRPAAHPAPLGSGRFSRWWCRRRWP